MDERYCCMASCYPIRTRRPEMKDEQRQAADSIKLPVRFDAENNHIFAADGGSIAWFPRNSHHPDFHRKAETGEYIAECINDHESLKGKLEAARTQLETIRNMDVYILESGPHATCDPAYRFAAAVDRAR